MDRTIAMAGRGRTASAEIGPDRGLWQGRLRFRRHVASRLAVVPAGCDLGLADRGAGADRSRALARVFDPAGEIDTLIIGTGTAVWQPAAAPRGTAQITVMLDRDGPAIRTYNIMIGEKRRVAAALIAVP